MSDSILSHGYVPEEHAPDPVIGHGDPAPPGKVAIWLFLASEIMFFIGMLGTYIVFRTGSTALFERHADTLSVPLATTNTVVLIFSSLTMALAVDAAQKNNRPRLILFLLITFLMACTFMGIKSYEYTEKLTHHTLVARDADNQFWIYDGYAVSNDDQTFVLEGVRMPMPAEPGFDLRWVAQADVKDYIAAAGGDPDAYETYTIPQANISQNLTYGPSRNIFYSCYYTLTGVHGVHVLGGMVPIAILLILGLRGRILAPATEYVGLYWHFVDLVWIFLFPLLYLI